MSQFRRRLLMMMQKAQDIWRDVVMTGTGLVVANDTTAGQPVKIFPQGWTEQAQYEGKNLFNPEQFYDKNTYSEKFGNYYLTTWQLKPNTVYRFTVYNNHVSPEDKGVMFFGFNDAYNNHNPNGVFVVFTSSDEKTIIENSGESGVLFVKINSKSDPETQLELLKNANFIISEGAEKIPYEPYTGGQPSPNPEYPQPITSAGKYNEETQKWEYEITIANAQTDPDKNQTVTLTADRPLTKWDKLEKRNGQWGWVYKSVEVVLDGSADETWYLAQTDSYNQFYINIDTVEHLSNEKNAYCKKFRPAAIADRETEKEIIYTVRAISGTIAVSTELATEIDAWKTWLQSNPITVLYRSIEETFVPLSESEQEQMNALRTYYPTTVFSNDQNGFMQIEYRTKYGVMHNVWNNQRRSINHGAESRYNRK